MPLVWAIILSVLGVAGMLILRGSGSRFAWPAPLSMVVMAWLVYFMDGVPGWLWWLAIFAALWALIVRPRPGRLDAFLGLLGYVLIAIAIVWGAFAAFSSIDWWWENGGDEVDFSVDLDALTEGEYAAIMAVLDGNLPAGAYDDVRAQLLEDEEFLQSLRDQLLNDPSFVGEFEITDEELRERLLSDPNFIAGLDESFATEDEVRTIVREELYALIDVVLNPTSAPDDVDAAYAEFAQYVLRIDTTAQLARYELEQLTEGLPALVDDQLRAELGSRWAWRYGTSPEDNPATRSGEFAPPIACKLMVGDRDGAALLGYLESFTADSETVQECLEGLNAGRFEDRRRTAADWVKVFELPNWHEDIAAYEARVAELAESWMSDQEAYEDAIGALEVAWTGNAGLTCFDGGTVVVEYFRDGNLAVTERPANCRTDAFIWTEYTTPSGDTVRLWHRLSCGGQGGVHTPPEVTPPEETTTTTTAVTTTTVPGTTTTTTTTVPAVQPDFKPMLIPLYQGGYELQLQSSQGDIVSYDPPIGTEYPCEFTGSVKVAATTADGVALTPRSTNRVDGNCPQPPEVVNPPPVDVGPACPGGEAPDASGACPEQVNPAPIFTPPTTPETPVTDPPATGDPGMPGTGDA